MLKAKHGERLDPVGSKALNQRKMFKKFRKVQKACETCRLTFVPRSTNSRLVFLPLSQPLSHRIHPVLVTNSFKTYFSDIIQTNCMFTCFCLCNGHGFVLRKTYVLPAGASILNWETVLPAWPRDEGGHYKEKHVIKNSDFLFHT